MTELRSPQRGAGVPDATEDSSPRDENPDQQPKPVATRHPATEATVATPVSPAPHPFSSHRVAEDEIDWDELNRRDTEDLSLVNRGRPERRRPSPRERLTEFTQRWEASWQRLRSAPTRTGERLRLLGQRVQLRISQRFRRKRGKHRYRGPGARVSWLAVFGLVVGFMGVLAALTVVLAPVGWVAGGTSVVLAGYGIVATRNPRLASRPLAVVGLLTGLSALVLSALADTGAISWLSGNDQVGRLADWMNGALFGADRC